MKDINEELHDPSLSNQHISPLNTLQVTAKSSEDTRVEFNGTYEPA
jgi:hypothetical protein